MRGPTGQTVFRGGRVQRGKGFRQGKSGTWVWLSECDDRQDFSVCREKTDKVQRREGIEGKRVCTRELWDLG